MALARYLTLVWPGMPWLWLRGSFAGLVLALAFAVAVDVAVLTTFIWTELVDVRMSLALWTATAAVWLVATASAVTGFPPPLTRRRDASTEPLFVAARDAYLGRDWLSAETKLRQLLAGSPLDGEAQLLLGSLLRRVDRLDEAEEALLKLSRSDAGRGWQAEIARELDRIAAARQQPAAAAGAAGAARDAGSEPVAGRRVAA